MDALLSGRSWEGVAARRRHARLQSRDDFSLGEGVTGPQHVEQVAVSIRDAAWAAGTRHHHGRQWRGGGSSGSWSQGAPAGHVLEHEVHVRGCVEHLGAGGWQGNVDTAYTA